MGLVQYLCVLLSIARVVTVENPNNGQESDGIFPWILVKLELRHRDAAHRSAIRFSGRKWAPAGMPAGAHCAFLRGLAPT